MYFELAFVSSLNRKREPTKREPTGKVSFVLSFELCPTVKARAERERSVSGYGIYVCEI